MYWCVGFAIFNENIIKHIKVIEHINFRLSYMIVNIDKRKSLGIIAVYAPTNCYDDIDKDEFYLQLHSLYAKVRQMSTVTILAGDFNGTIDSQTIPKIKGRYSYDELNDNGERLKNFCTQNRISIVNSFFKKRWWKKFLWIKPQSIEDNIKGRLCVKQLDYFLCNMKRIFTDVETWSHKKFDATVSDHRLVKATIKFPKKLCDYIKKSRCLQKKVLHYNIKYEKSLNEVGEKELIIPSNEFKNVEKEYSKFIKEIKRVTKLVTVEKQIPSTRYSEHVKSLFSNRRKLLNSLSYSDNHDDKQEIKSKILMEIRLINKLIRQTIKDEWNSLVHDRIKEALENNKKIKSVFRVLKESTTSES